MPTARWSAVDKCRSMQVSLTSVEATARDAEVDVQALQPRRKMHSKSVLEQIEALAPQHLHGVLPGSLAGQGASLRDSAVAQGRALPGGRALPRRQQCLRERDSSVRGRAPQLALRQHGGRRERQREPVLAAADLPGQQDRRPPVPQGAARRVELPKARTVDDYEALLPWLIALAGR
jgi:transposase